MTTNNTMPEVIWAHLFTGSAYEGKFQTSKWEGLFETSYTRTDLLEQRAILAAERLIDSGLIRNIDGLTYLETENKLTAIILAALKGETSGRDSVT